MTQSPSILLSLGQVVTGRPINPASPGGNGVALVDGEQTGWLPYTSLRCSSVLMRRGANPGVANFDYVTSLADAGSLPQFEGTLLYFHPDDQVRVVVQPLNTQLGLGGEDVELVVFEGVLLRQRFATHRAGDNRDDERVDFMAVAMPVIENQLAEHLVAGRWVLNPETEGEDDSGDEPVDTLRIIESPAASCVFNFRGRPNCDTSKTLTANVLTDLTAHPFTARGDDAPDADWWTPRRAIRSLLVTWLYGTQERPLRRVSCIAPDTLDGLNDETSSDPRWLGLDNRLPPVDVRGLGVWDAIDAVCKAAGFEFSILPNLSGEPAGDNEDRTYRFELWRRASGRANELRLMKPDQFSPTDPLLNLEHNDASHIRGMRDGLRTYPVVLGRGVSMVEATFELKPMWSPDDMAVATLEELTAATPQKPSTGTATELSLYHTRHVSGGSQYDRYRYVGRRWGIDCTGAWADVFYSIDGEVPAYAHAEGGFDFVDYLELNEEGSSLLLERADNGIEDPIVWTRRARVPHPIRRPYGRLRGIEYLVEVSEDSGETWAAVPVKATPEDELGFVFMLSGAEVENLACVSAATMSTKARPAIADSWFARIIDGTLRVRITCAVEADHAARYDATRTATAGSVYDRAKLIDVEGVEYWVAPSSLNTLSEADVYERAGGAGVVAPSIDGGAADFVTNVRHVAELKRAAWERLEMPCFAETWLIRPNVFRVGDRIDRIAGRDFSLSGAALGSGDGRGTVSVAAIELVLSGHGERPDQNQVMRLYLEDHKTASDI